MKKLLLVFILLSVLILNAQHFQNVKIYMWDNDKGGTFRNPDNTEKYIGYEYNMIKAMNRLGFDTSVNKNLTVGTTLPDWKDLLSFSAVVVVCGNRPYTDEILTSDDIDNLRGYLEAGGCLYVEGNNFPEYLKARGQEDFLVMYFNNVMSDNGGTTYTGYDTIITDTNSTFSRPYTFVYPAGTAPDLSVDAVSPYMVLPAPYYYSVLVYDEQKGTKLYKSTATAYTPPDTKGVYYFPGKTYMQTTVFGAYADPTQKGILPDSIQNQLIRAAYLRDVLRFFSIGRVLLVKDDGEVKYTDEGIRKALEKSNIYYDEIEIPSKSAGPLYTAYVPYTTVIWYTGEDGSTVTLTDTLSLGYYLTFGGNLIMGGDNIAEDLGYPGVNEQGGEFPFLEKYLAIDYLSSASATDVDYFSASKNSFYYNYSATEIIFMGYKTPSYNDVIRPFVRDTFVDTAFYIGSLKAPAIAGVTNIGTTHKSVFLGFAFEYLQQENLDGFINATFTDLLDYDLEFINTGYQEKPSLTAPVKSAKNNPIINYSNGYIFIADIDDARIIDVTGRHIMNVSEGYTAVRAELRDGVYFVIGRSNGEIVRKTIVKM